MNIQNIIVVVIRNKSINKLIINDYNHMTKVWTHNNRIAAKVHHPMSGLGRRVQSPVGTKLFLKPNALVVRNLQCPLQGISRRGGEQGERGQSFFDYFCSFDCVFVI